MLKTRPGPLIIGATGKLGLGMRKARLPALKNALWQSRTPRKGFIKWDILSEPMPNIRVTGVVMIARADSSATDVELAQAACEVGATHGVKVLLASSQAVYGRLKGPLTESSPTTPIDDNGGAKLAMERAVEDYACVTSLRIGNVAGAGPLFWNMAKGSVLLDEVSPGEGPCRAFIGPATFGMVISNLLQKAELPRILNVANPGLIDMADILRAAGVDWTWRVESRALSSVELDVSTLLGMVHLPDADPTKLLSEAKLTGWQCHEQV